MWPSRLAAKSYQNMKEYSPKVRRSIEVRRAQKRASSVSWRPCCFDKILKVNISTSKNGRSDKLPGIVKSHLA